MDGVKFELNDITSCYHCIRKTILSENGQSAYENLLSIFDDIIYIFAYLRGTLFYISNLSYKS